METEFRKRNKKLSTEREGQTSVPTKRVASLFMRNKRICQTEPRKGIGIEKTGQGAAGLN